jgi:predicted HD phosphohydrolase
MYTPHVKLAAEKQLPGTPMKASFNKMSDSKADDWQIIVQEQKAFVGKLPDRILAHMALLDNDYGGFPVDRLQHSLQTAELAANAGEDDEYVVCALLHDIGDTLGSTNHPDVAAAIMQPFISEANHWMVKHHGMFQGYNFFHHLGLDRNMRDQFADSPHYQRTVDFINKYDDLAFDESKPKLSLSLFEDQVRKVFSNPVNSIYKDVMQK